ncbi:glycosyl transferase, group 1 family protein [Aciduliprofundum boonei T469]|nr:glycosyl transferase, group 1 family protein [Aciduliprofundum boonei T469]
MKNLLVISDRYPHKEDPYSASFVKKLIKYEKEYFENVYVISVNPWLPPLIAKRMSNPRWYKDAIAEDYEYDNVHVYFAKYLTGRSMFFLRRKDKFAYPKLERIIKKNHIKFDIVHAHFAHPAGGVALRIAKKYEKPVVVTAHAHEIREYPFMDEKLKEKILWVLNNADVLITVSQDNVRKMREFGYGGDVHVIPNGYDPEVFRPMDKGKTRKELGLPENKKIIVSVGRLIPRKGYIYLIEAIDNLRKKRDDFFTVVIGDGPLREELRNEVKRRNLENYINFIGEIPLDEDVARYIASADIFVLPTLDEGNPTVMFESLGCGVPFIGSRVAGIPEIITSEEYGLLTEPKNPKDLEEKINTALDTRWDKGKILNYAAQFTWKSIAEKTVKIYETI